jgi:hypothetical protein
MGLVYYHYSSLQKHRIEQRWLSFRIIYMSEWLLYITLMLSYFRSFLCFCKLERSTTVTRHVSSLKLGISVSMHILLQALIEKQFLRHLSNIFVATVLHGVCPKHFCNVFQGSIIIQYLIPIACAQTIYNYQTFIKYVAIVKIKFEKAKL